MLTALHRVWATLLVALALLVIDARPAQAHAAPHSVVLLDLRAHDVDAELRLPVPELEASLGRPLQGDGAGIADRERDTLRAIVERDLRARSHDGTPWTVIASDVTYGVDDAVPLLVVHAVLTPPAGTSPRAFTLVDDVIGRDVMNHAAWIAVRSDFVQGLVGGAPQVAGVTHYMSHEVAIERADGTSIQGFRAVVRLGMQHIAEGTDHLLFLLALLLPAPLLVRADRKRWSEGASAALSGTKLLRIVTAFTVGHSLTLLIGTIGWVRLPSAPVETLIAVSILLSAIHALRPLFPGREAWVAGGFGLVHGLAFARALAEMHLDTGSLAIALFGFNVGIELMQLVVLGATFPWLVLLARTPVYSTFRIGGAAFAGIAAIGWIAERALHRPNPIAPIVGRITEHPYLLLVGLAVLSIAARWRSQKTEPVLGHDAIRFPNLRH